MTGLQFPLSSRSAKSSLRQPREILSYSIDINGKQHIGSNQELRYYYFPETVLPGKPDLNEGVKSFIEKSKTESGHLNELLRALIHYERTLNNGKRVKGDFVTYRGVMTRLLTLPFSQNEDLDINIVWFDGQIFLELDFELLEFKRREETERSKLMSYWGYKFEALATLPKPWSQCTREEIEGRRKNVVDNISEYCTVVRTGVGKMKVVLGAEVDCVSDYKASSDNYAAHYKEEGQDYDYLMDEPPSKDDTNPLHHYLELKTSRYIVNPNVARQFEGKLLKSWAQSFLIGVPKIVYGFRDDGGFVKSVEEFDTAEIPKMVFNSSYTDAKSKWNGNECVSFYAAVLAWIKAAVPEDEKKAWRLQYKASADVLELVQLHGFEEQKVLEHLILPEFAEWRRSR